MKTQCFERRVEGHGNRSLHLRVLGVVFASILFAASGGSLCGAEGEGAAAVETKGDASVPSLLELIPDRSNALVVVRMDQLLKSERARREHWGADARTDFLSGALTLPPWVRVMVRGTHLHPGPGGDESTVAVLELIRPVDMNRVATLEGSQVRKLGEVPVVHSPRNCYFVQLGVDRLAVVSPGFRQDVAAWLDGLSSPGRLKSEGYLAQSAASAADIVFALDLKEMFEPEYISAMVSSSDRFRGREGVKSSVEKLLTSLRGARFLIQVEDQIQGELVLDFAEGVGDIGADVHALASEFLADSGFLIEELSGARVVSEGNCVRMQMGLSDLSFENVMTLAVMPHSAGEEPVKESAAQTDSTSGSSSSKPVVIPKSGHAATLRYFTEVDRSITRLLGLNRRAKDLGTTASWYDNYASKIESLPKLNVDTDALHFGESVRQKLLAIASSLNGQAVQINALERSVTYETTYDPGSYGITYWGGVYGRPPSTWTTSNLAEVRRRQAEAVARGAQDRVQVWEFIQQEQRETRALLNRRYGKDFD